MGIKNLATFLQKHHPRLIHEVPDLSIYKGTRFAIDVSIFMYRFRYGTDESSASRKAIENFMKQYEWLRSFGIDAVYVFDGDGASRSGVKDREREKRTESRKRQAERVEEDREWLRSKRARIVSGDHPLVDEGHCAALAALASIDRELEASGSRTMPHITAEDFARLRRAFASAGVPHVTTNCEAELACCLLVEDGLADVVVTDDQDALAGGAKRWLRWLGSPSHQAAEIRIDEVLDALGLTMEAFVDFCILCGCDFCSTLKGVGPENAYKIVKEYGSIEAILAAPRFLRFRMMTGGRPPGFTFEAARDQFLGTWRKALPCTETVVGWQIIVLTATKIASVGKKRAAVGEKDGGTSIEDAQSKHQERRNREQNPVV